MLSNSSKIKSKRLALGSKLYFRHLSAAVTSDTPLEFVFEEQNYSSLHSGRSLAWDHVRGDIDDPCGAIVDFCGVIADPCGVVAIPEAIGGRRSLRESLNIIKHSKT